MVESFLNIDNILPDWTKENEEKISCWGREGGGGDSKKNWVGMCRLLPKTFTLFMTKIFNFPFAIYDLTKN